MPSLPSTLSFFSLSFFLLLLLSFHLPIIYLSNHWMSVYSFSCLLFHPLISILISYLLIHPFNSNWEAVVSGKCLDVVIFISYLLNFGWNCLYQTVGDTDIVLCGWVMEHDLCSNDFSWAPLWAIEVCSSHQALWEDTQSRGIWAAMCTFTIRWFYSSQSYFI